MTIGAHALSQTACAASTPPPIGSHHDRCDHQTQAAQTQCHASEGVVASLLLQVRDMEPGSAVWIAKPSITNQGAGIAVFDSCAGLRSVLEGSRPVCVTCRVGKFVQRLKRRHACSSPDILLPLLLLVGAPIPKAERRNTDSIVSTGAPDLREWVVQRYIADPLLVGGRKFHLRAYVLCVGDPCLSELLCMHHGALAMCHPSCTASRNCPRNFRRILRLPSTCSSFLHYREAQGVCVQRDAGAVCWRAL